MLQVVPPVSTTPETATTFVVSMDLGSVAGAVGALTYLHTAAGLGLACLDRSDGLNDASVLSAVEQLFKACPLILSMSTVEPAAIAEPALPSRRPMSRLFDYWDSWRGYVGAACLFGLGLIIATFGYGRAVCVPISISPLIFATMLARILWGARAAWVAAVLSLCIAISEFFPLQGAITQFPAWYLCAVGSLVVLLIPQRI
jgi:hypothetical protein